MKRLIDIKLLASFFMAAAMAGCQYEDFYNTIHPNECVVVVDADFSRRSEEATLPGSYDIVMGRLNQRATVGTATVVDTLLSPGAHSMLLYTPVEGFGISGTQATVNAAGAGLIDPEPQYLYSAVAAVEAVADDTVRLAPVMRQLVRRLDIVLTAVDGDYERVASAVATLDGVASAVDIATGALTAGASASVTKPFDRDGATFSVYFRLLGVDPSQRQNLSVEITYVDGTSEVVTSEVTDLFDGIMRGEDNPGGGFGDMPPLVLTGELDLQLEIGMSGTIGGWTQTEGGSIDAH